MEDENIFSYGPYKLYKDAFDVNIRENLEKYVKTAGLTSLEEQDFRAAVDFINKGIGSYITSMSGSGTFKDNKGYLKKDNRGHQHAAKYIHTIANKQGALGNATPKKKSLAEEPVEGSTKEIFDPTKHFIGIKFENEFNPTGLDTDYTYWKGTANGATLHEHLRNYIKTNYLDKGFDQYDFSKTNVTSDYYKGMLNSLYNSLADGVSEDDIKKMQILGFKNPLAFKPVAKPVVKPGLGQEEGNLDAGLQDFLTGEDVAAIKKEGFRMGDKTWLDSNGKDTGITLDLDPRNQQILINLNVPENKIDWDEIGSVWGPIALDIVSIVNPEPITGTLAGLGGDIWTIINDEERGSNWWRHGLNFLSTAAGILPWIGDIANVNKVWQKIKKAGPILIGLTSAASVPLIAMNGEETFNLMKSSLSKAIGLEDGEMTKEDWANIAHLATSMILLRLFYKTGKDFKNIREQTRLDPDKVAVVKGKDVNGDTRKYVVEGPESKPLKEANTVEDIKSNFSDRGIEVTSLPLNEKNIFNPDLARQMASGSNKKTQKLTEYMVGDDKTGRRMMGKNSSEASSTPRTTGKPKLDDLRAKVEAKLKGEKGLTDEAVKEVDLLLRKLSENAPKKDYWERLKDLVITPKPRKEYTEAREALIKKELNADEVDELLKGFFKQGGILKASTGLKINVGDIDLKTYKGWDEHFIENPDKTYSLKEGYNSDALTKWGTTNGLNITLPTLKYGTDNYKYTEYNSLYEEGATSKGFKQSNGLRSDQLMHDTPDTTGELDLNEHAESRKMYQQIADAEKGLSSGDLLRRRDFLNWVSKNYEKGMTRELLLEKYNVGVDKMYQFKRSDEGITYTGDAGLGNAATKEFFDLNNDYYTSQNTPSLHGAHEDSSNQNGSTMMGRSVDRTNVILSDFTDEELKNFNIYKGGDGLYEILSGNSFTNDGTGRYYIGNADVTITKANGTSDQTADPENKKGKGEEGEVSLPGDDSNLIGPNGDPLLKKKSPDLSPLFSAFNYYGALRANKDILKLSKNLPTLLYDPVEHYRSVYGNLRAVLEGQRLAAELRNIASRPMTSDGSMQMAAMMDAQNLGLKYVEAGLKADDEMMRLTSEAAWQQEKENKMSRHQTAMKNRENIHQTAVTKLQAEASKKTADYQSTKLFVDELQKYYITEKAKNDKKKDALYSLNLQLDIYKNPQNYLADWNSYHDFIWRRGIKGLPLSNDVETQIFNNLKQKAQLIYYNLLYYNTSNVDTSVKDIVLTASDFSVIRALQGSGKIPGMKKGGTIDTDLAKVVLGYLKEANKNYNKAVDRSARGMYNYIKQQRKKK